MNVKLRPGTPEDAETCGRICYEAFGAIARKHAFPSDIPAPEVGVGLVSMLLAHPGFYSVVAEANGKVVGSNFLDERSAIAGVGPITVDPTVQDRGIGRVLMQAVIKRAADHGNPGVRLLQSAYHTRSLSALLLFPWVGSGALRRVRGRSSQVKGAWRRRCREGAARPPGPASLCGPFGQVLAGRPGACPAGCAAPPNLSRAGGRR